MKKKNQTSATNRYLLVGLSLFCILMMVFSSFSDKVSGPFKVLALHRDPASAGDQSDRRMAR